MVLFNYSTRELTAKVVYYGPGICGKTTNLQFIHENLPGEVKGKMLSLATKTDRTLFFDFLPIDLGEIRGMKTRVQLYTVPGQVFYNETRKLVLKGVDGIVFVADSQETMLGANAESFKNLEENLKAHGMKLSEIPHVIQFNKRDLPKLSSIEDMNAGLNKFNAPFYESVATTGIGVQDTLKAIVKLVLLNLTKKYESKSTEPMAASASARASVAASAPPSPPSRAAVAVANAPDTHAASFKSVAASSPAKVKPQPRKAAPPPPPPSPPAAETMAPFAEEEIDGLVGEVEELDPPMPAPPAMAAIPVMPAEVAPPVEDGAWLGLPEDSEDANYGTSGGALEDLLAKEAAATTASTAPAQDWPPAEAARSEFEIDRGFDPEWARPGAPEPAPIPLAPRAATPPPAVSYDPEPEIAAMTVEPEEDLVPIAPFPIPGNDVLLTEVASDEDLFTDPSLEIAHLAEGEGREIVVPVLLGDGPSARRYKLAIRLRLDPID